MDILVAGKGIAEDRISGEVGQYPQLDLGVVGGDETVPLGGNEGMAYQAPLFAADRNVLQLAGSTSLGRASE